MTPNTYNVRFYYENTEEGTITYLDDQTNTIGNLPKSSKFIKNTEGKNEYHYFELMKKYEKTTEDLQRYKADFWGRCQELQKEGIYYQKYNTDFDAVELSFKRYSTRRLKEFPIEPVNYDEYFFAEKCYNAGIMYFDDQYKEKEVNCFGYDFSAFYPNLLVSKYLKIPTKPAKKVKIEEVDFSKAQYGIYKVDIVCNHPDFNKVFCYSKNGYYTHLSLWFANFYKAKYSVSIILDRNVEFNALVYDEADLIDSACIFQPWFDKMMEVKTKYKGNALAKHLFSSLWGALCKFRRKFLYDDELDSVDWGFAGEGCDFTLVKQKYYMKKGRPIGSNEFIDTHNPYKSVFGRLKPYLLALSRNVVGMLILRNNLASDVLRIQTDGFVLIKPYNNAKHKMCGLSPVEEDKTTGLILWSNVNKYERIV